MKCLARGGVGLGHADGRHGAGAQLADDLFPGLGVGGGVGGVEAFEHEAAGFEALAVASDAVFGGERDIGGSVGEWDGEKQCGEERRRAEAGRDPEGTPEKPGPTNRKKEGIKNSASETHLICCAKNAQLALRVPLSYGSV